MKVSIPIGLPSAISLNDLPVPFVATESQQNDTTTYRIELYFVEPWHGRDASENADYEGLRIFDVAVNEETVIDDLDTWTEAGYCGAMKRVVTAKAQNGKLHISFPKVKAGQAVICAIAIASAQSVAVPQRQATGESWHSLDTDTIAKLPKELLPHDTESRPASTYLPNSLSKGQKGFSSFIIKPGLGQEYALRFKYKNTTGSAQKARLIITDSKRTVLVDREITFPPTPNKFKTLSTTTGTQINAGTYTVRIDNKEVEFKELEIQ